MAYELNIEMYKHAPWGGETGLGDIVVYDVDWSGATFLWQFGAPDDLAPDISLGNAAAGSEGVSATYGSYTDPISGEVGFATVIRPQIDESTLEALTYSGVSDLSLEHTLYITPSSEPKRVEAYGGVVVKQLVADA